MRSAVHVAQPEEKKCDYKIVVLIKLQMKEPFDGWGRWWEVDV
jgi:hypothetical protein